MTENLKIQLNPTQERYKAFPERGTAQSIEQMHALIAEGRIPLSVADLMEARLEHGKELTDWMDHPFVTGDAVIYHPNGRIKIALDSENLREINPESRLFHGALVLDDGIYDSIPGQEFKKVKIEKYGKQAFSPRKVKSNPIWQTLARNQNLLNEYTDFIFAQAEQRGCEYNKMRLDISPFNYNTPQLRAWGISGLESGSFANGYPDLDSHFCKLVGLAPWARASKIGRKQK